MARLYSCDRCREQVEDSEDGRKEWTHINLCKTSTPSTPFQSLDLCQDCTKDLRRLISNPSPSQGL